MLVEQSPIQMSGRLDFHWCQGFRYLGMFTFGYHGLRSSFLLRIEVGRYKSGSPSTSSSSALPLSPVSLPGQRLCAQQVWPHTALSHCSFYFDNYAQGICAVL